MENPVEQNSTRLRLKTSLSALQTVVGLTAGLMSIAGALVAVPKFFEAPSGKGEVVAVIQEAKTQKAMTDATVEILTLRDAIVTTVKPNYFGKARYTLEEGRYRVRVSHPGFTPQVRQVQVVAGQTAEVRVQLRGGASSAIRGAERVIEEGVGAVRRVFGQ